MIVLIKLRNIVLEIINNIIFIFNSYLVITESWHIQFSFVNFVHISRTITYNKNQQKNGRLIAPKKIPAVATIQRNKNYKNIQMVLNFRNPIQT